MKAQNDAAITAATTAWPQGHTYRVGEVPDNPATPYNVVSVDSGVSRNYRTASRSTSAQRRIVVQSVGATYNEAAFAVEKADAAFLDKRLTAGATPARREIAGNVQRDPDGGVLMYALNTYTYTTPA